MPIGQPGWFCVRIVLKTLKTSGLCAASLRELRFHCLKSRQDLRAVALKLHESSAKFIGRHQPVRFGAGVQEVRSQVLVVQLQAFRAPEVVNSFSHLCWGGPVQLLEFSLRGEDVSPRVPAALQAFLYVPNQGYDA